MTADQDPATDRHRSLLELDARQLLAIDALMTGATHEDAAAAAGVHRVTVSRWVGRHPAVIAELRRRRREVVAQSNDRLRALLDRAAEVVAARVEDGDVDAALAVLRWAGPQNVFQIASPKPDAPEAVLDELVERGARARFVEPLLATVDAASGATAARERAREEALEAITRAAGPMGGESSSPLQTE